MNAFGGRNRDFSHLLTNFIRNGNARTFFDQLLMASLHGTFTLEQVNHVAMGVAENLDLNVFWILNKAFDKNTVVAKKILSFGLAGSKGRSQLLGFVNHANSFSATSGRGFDDHWKTNALSLFLGFLNRRHWAGTSRNSGHTRLLHQFPRVEFVSHGYDVFCGWTNKCQASLFDSFCKFGGFTEESVSGVNRFRSRFFCNFNDLVDPQIRFGTGCRTNVISFVRQHDMKSISIGFAVNRHGSNSQFTKSASHSNCDFSTVGDENFFKHRSLLQRNVSVFLGGIAIPFVF